MEDFKYEVAFRSNLGWVTEPEQRILKQAAVGIAGMGGVGGGHLITLVRLGIEKFHIADFDIYEMHNFNRQYGADMETLGQKKADVMLKKARAINPNVQIKIFSEGLNDSNIEDFLSGMNLFVDGLDVHCLEMRKKVFRLCEKMKIPATTVAPMGMGAALINFLPGKMSFQDYFGFKGNESEDFFRFIAGLSPHFLQKKSLIERNYLKIKEKKAPSTPMGCFLASGVLGTEALKILLSRGRLKAAPWAIHYDAYTYKLSQTWTIFGQHNPIFWAKVFYLKNKLKGS